MNILLGAGNEQRPGWKTLDNNVACHPDILHDLCVLPLPFKDNTVDMLEANQVLEHIPGQLFIPLMNDCFRILKPKGIFKIDVPYGVGYARLMDPTHFSSVFFVEHTWKYFSKQGLLELGLFHQYGNIDTNFIEVEMERHGPNGEGLRVVLRAEK